MAKVKISISRIKCLRTTWEISPDEIYYALYFFSGEVDSAGHPIIDASKRQVRASEIMENVVRDLSWKPAPSEQIFDLGEAKAFGFLLLLGEKDNGKFYEKIVSGDAIAKFVKLNPQLPTIPDNPGDWKSWIPVIAKFLAALVRDLFEVIPADDGLIPFDSEPFGYALTDPRLDVEKSHIILLKGGFGKYEVELKIEVLKNE